jgi:hypothetical protein
LPPACAPPRHPPCCAATFFHDGDPGCDRNNWLGCDPNGGCNSSDVASFAPTNLNVSNWIDSFQALGATSAVLTAKHGCGFLAWETNTTLPDGTPYRYHVSAEQSTARKFVAATTAAGIGHGFYYSLTNNFFLNAAGHNVQPPSTLLPGQANVTQAQYEDLALAQVKELWTEFGDLTEIWVGCPHAPKLTLLPAPAPKRPLTLAINLPTPRNAAQLSTRATAPCNNRRSWTAAAEQCATAWARLSSRRTLPRPWPSMAAA